MASVYTASLVFLPDLRQTSQLVPYTVLIISFAISVCIGAPEDAPTWHHVGFMLFRSLLAFFIYLVSGESIGLIPALYFIVIPTGYFELPFPAANAFSLLCLLLMVLGFLVSYNLPSALSVLFPYAGGVFFFAAASAALVQQGRERQRAEQLLAELEQAHRQLRAYSAQAEALAVAEERYRLAREIHDSLGHYLTAVAMHLEAAGKLVDSEPDRAAHSIRKAEELARDSLTEVRRSVAALRASPLDAEALGDAIEELVTALREGGTAATFTQEGQAYPLSIPAKMALYRAAQEGLTNVRKHASASAVDVKLVYEPNQVNLTISDNGIGKRGGSDEGFGLLGLRERLAVLGGSLKSGNRPEGGFVLHVIVPVDETDNG